jgi:hypothetical protein
VTGPHHGRLTPGLRHRIVLLVFVAALLAVLTASGPPTGPRMLAATAVLSRSERAGDVSLGRDCGYSQPLPGSPRRSLWLFCDTPVYFRARNANGRDTWALKRFISGSTAAVGPAVADSGAAASRPGWLSEVATPGAENGAGAGSGGPGAGGGTPAPFLPTPPGLVTLAGRPCDGGSGSYATSWMSGVTRIPSSQKLLIAFNNYCVLGGSGGFLPEGSGLAEYDPAADRLSNEVTVFSGDGLSMAASAKLLGSPVFSGSYLYLSGPTCTALAYGRCATGAVFEARVAATPQAWTNPFAYQWWSRGPVGGWTLDAAAATSIIPGARPSAVSVADFSSVGHGLVLVEQTDINGGYTVYESRAPAGTWKRITSGRVPCRAGQGYANFCRAIIGHPEFSTRTQLVLSYFDPAAGARGHVMVAGFPWQALRQGTRRPRR